jgi:hypothetical protein
VLDLFPYVFSTYCIFSGYFRSSTVILFFIYTHSLSVRLCPKCVRMCVSTPFISRQDTFCFELYLIDSRYLHYFISFDYKTLVNNRTCISKHNQKKQYLKYGILSVLSRLVDLNYPTTDVHIQRKL